MNEHAGLASLISVLIVVGFTIILHETERPAPLAVSPAMTSTPIAHHPSPPPALSPPNAAQSHTVAVAAPTLPPPQLEPPAHRVVSPGPPPHPVIPATLISTPPNPRPPTRVASEPAPVRAMAPPILPQLPGTPHATVTVVEPGERLVDVAVRVYGSAAAVTRIWHANRDRLASTEAPVTAGWLLRTP